MTMTSRAEPLRSLHSIVRSRNGKISLPSLHPPAIFGKNFGFFFSKFSRFCVGKMQKYRSHLITIVRSRNGKISLPSVGTSSRDFRKKFRFFFFKIFAFLCSEDAEIPQPSSTPFNDNGELITKYY